MSVVWILLLLLGLAFVITGVYLVAKAQGKAEEGNDDAMSSGYMIGGGIAIALGVLMTLVGGYKAFAKQAISDALSE
jgi:uncharacterized membrane protein